MSDSTPRRLPPETLTHIVLVMAEVCDTSPDLVTPEAHLSGFGIDSVRVLQLVGQLEDDFHITLNLDAIISLTTVADLVAFVERVREGEAM